MGCVLELKIIQSGMLHRACSEETQAQAEPTQAGQRCVLEWGKAEMTPHVLLSKQTVLSGMAFFGGSVSFV